MSKTIFISGNFNILHPGHLRLLRFARELGEELIVGVHSDRLGGEAIHVPEDLRLEGVQSNIWVTKAFIIDTPVSETIKQIKPDIVGLLSVASSAAARTSFGGTAPNEVRARIADARQRFAIG